MKSILTNFCAMSTSGNVLFKIMTNYDSLSYEVVSGSEISPCNKIDKSLVVYKFTGNVTTSITMLLT